MNHSGDHQDTRISTSSRPATQPSRSFSTRSSPSLTRMNAFSIRPEPATHQDVVFSSEAAAGDLMGTGFFLPGFLYFPLSSLLEKGPGGEVSKGRRSAFQRRRARRPAATNPEGNCSLSLDHSLQSSLIPPLHGQLGLQALVVAEDGGDGGDAAAGAEGDGGALLGERSRDF